MEAGRNRCADHMQASAEIKKPVLTLEGYNVVKEQLRFIYEAEEKAISRVLGKYSPIFLLRLWSFTVIALKRHLTQTLRRVYEKIIE